MFQLAWTTDLHLNFVDDAGFDQLIAQVLDSGGAGLLVGGDIAEAPTFTGWLRRLANRVPVPVYFVLGNHDYYRGSISAVRRAALAISEAADNLTWLPADGIVQLSEATVLVGHGGWGDGRCGDFRNSNVLLNDYLLIDELRTVSMVDDGLLDSDQTVQLPQSLLQKLNELGDEAADHFRRVLPRALDQGRNILVLMHVPPFREACWHQGQLSDDNWSPHFTCAAAGQVLRQTMLDHPDHSMTVLCGHTHSSGIVRILPNLEVLTGGAQYGQPEVQRMLRIDPAVEVTDAS